MSGLEAADRLSESFLHNSDQEEEETSRWCWSSGKGDEVDDEESTAENTENLKNKYWVEVPDIFTMPLLKESGRRPTKVRLETMPQWQLTLAAVVLAAGIFIPQAIIKVAVITDDDFVSEADGCRPSVNGTVDDDRGRSICDWEADIRMDISLGIVLFTIAWLFVVIREWKCRSLRLQHGAVLLFLFGQLLLEDPIDAYRVRFNGHYAVFTVGGMLRPTQQHGCGLMTFATLLLIDYCRRADGSKSIGCTKFFFFFISSLWPSAYYSINWAVFWPPFSHKTNTKEDYPDLFAAAFCAAVMFVSLLQMLSAYRIVRNASYMTHRYRNLLLRLFLPFAFGNLLIVTLWAESFVVLYVTTLALPAFLAFAHLPPTLVANHAIIRHRKTFLKRIFDEQKQKAKLLSRPLLLRSASMGDVPSRNTTMGSSFFSNFTSEYHSVARDNGGGGGDGGDGGGTYSGGGGGGGDGDGPVRRGIGKSQSAFEVLTSNPLVKKMEKVMDEVMDEVENAVGLGVGTVGNIVGVDLNMGPQRFQEDEEYFSFSEDEESPESDNGNSNKDASGSEAPSANQQQQSERTPSQQASNVMDRGDPSPNHRRHQPKLSSKRQDMFSMDATNHSPKVPLVYKSPAQRKYEEELSTKKELCLETALWAAQFSNLVYWDPPAKDGNEFTATLNGCGEMNMEDTEGLARSGISLIGNVYNEETLTMVHIYDDRADIPNLSTSPSKPASPETSGNKTTDYNTDSTTAAPATAPAAASTNATIEGGTDEKSGVPLNLSEKVEAEEGGKDSYIREPGSLLHSVSDRTSYASSTKNPLNDQSNEQLGNDTLHHSTSMGNGNEARTLWISFRGTASSKEISKDLDTKQIPLWLEEGGVVSGNSPTAHCHRGFWSAYKSIRHELHTILGKELTRRTRDRRPICLVFCGHSLGGALASIAALDFSLALKKRKILVSIPEPSLHESSGDSMASCGSVRLSEPMDEESPSPFIDPLFAMGAKKSVALIECFSFGSPRIGDLKLSLLAKRSIPRTWRVVYEGDVVTAMPRVHCGRFKLCELCSPRCFCGNICGLHEYKHVGFPLFIGRKSRIGGDLLVNPTQIERVAYLHWARSVNSHMLYNYIKGLTQASRRIADSFPSPSVESSGESTLTSSYVPPPAVSSSLFLVGHTPAVGDSDSPTYRGDFETTRVPSIDNV